MTRGKESPEGGIIYGGHIYISTRGGPTLLSRAIMEAHLERELNIDEVVHHIDGDPTNDELSNLQVITRAEHSSIHKLNKHPSEFTKELMSRAKRGKPSPRKGATLSKETKERIRNSKRLRKEQMKRWAKEIKAQ